MVNAIPALDMGETGEGEFIMGKREERDRDRERERDLRTAARAGAQGGSIEEARTVGFLCSLSPAELVRVLGQVFAEAVPFAGEEHIIRSKYYLGIAWADRISVPGEPDEWGEWHIEAAGYHRSGMEFTCSGDSLHNESTCPKCKLRSRSNDSIIVCPVCGDNPTQASKRQS
jgi:hypothetical protein